MASFASYGYVHINAGYFHLLCYNYQLKIESLNNRFKKIVQESTPIMEWNRQISHKNKWTLKIFLNRLNKINISLKQDNQFWKQIIGMIYFFFVLIISLSMNAFIFFELDFFKKSFLLTFSLSCLSIILLIALSSAKVNSQLKMTAKNLDRVLNCENLFAHQKIKVIYKLLV